MKTRFWKVQVETYRDGTVKAAILGSRDAYAKPSDKNLKDQWREISVRWYGNETNAQDAVFVALNGKGKVAA